MKGIAIVALLAVSAVCVAQSMSIDNEPVRVTHRNSGPRYDVGEIDRLLSSIANENSNNNNANDNKRAEDGGSSSSSSDEKPFGVIGRERPAANSDSEETPVGRITIKRIVLVPMSMPSRWSSAAAASDKSGADKDDDDETEQTAPSAPRGSQAEPTDEARRLFWPLMARPGPVISSNPSLLHHLFGADEASRSPQSEREPANVRPVFSSSGTERESDNDNEASQPVGGRPIPAFDPIQMMVDMMRQTIEEQLKHAAQDLNKAESAQNSSSPSDGVTPTPSASESSDESIAARPPSVFTRLFGAQPGAMGQSRNKTQEDTIVIDGKKFVRKLVENRHVGDNFVFMTRRYMLVPQNSTDDQPPSTTTTTTTTLAPPSTTSTPAPTSTAPEATTATPAPTSTTVLSNESSDKATNEASSTTETPLPSATVVSERLISS